MNRAFKARHDLVVEGLNTLPGVRCTPGWGTFYAFAEIGQAMRDVGAALRADPKFGPMILADIDVLGVERWELWGMLLRCRVKVLPTARDSVRREFNLRLSKEMKTRGLKTA